MWLLPKMISKVLMLWSGAPARCKTELAGCDDTVMLYTQSPPAMAQEGRADQYQGGES